MFCITAAEQHRDYKRGLRASEWDEITEWYEKLKVKHAKSFSGLEEHK
jgi:hypothetical protein